MAIVVGDVRSSTLAALEAQRDAMVDALAALVAVESPSLDLGATAVCADATAAVIGALLEANPERIVVDGHVHLRWQFGSAPRVVLVGHLDTVWPKGTLDRWPFSVTDGIATGPGAFDMKAGIVQGGFALACLADLDGITLLLTSDEEIGSPSSRRLIEETVKGASAALVLEPSAGGALKTSRKGTATYELEISGRAAHAGLEPEKGVNASVELAHQVLALAGLARPDIGTTVTPTLVLGGTSANSVPARAVLTVDVRAATVDEQHRVDAALRTLRPVLAESSLTLHGVPNRPPLEASASAALFDRAAAIAAGLGLPPLEGVAVGGGSDGNFTAALGIPTLDGLGAVGAGAHAEDEHVVVAAMPARAALLAGLVAAVLAEPVS